MVEQGFVLSQDIIPGPASNALPALLSLQIGRWELWKDHSEVRDQS